jgi:predicted dehydrogenase
MNLGLIGSGNQASKLLKLIIKKKKFTQIIIFHPIKEKNQIKDQFIKNIKNKKIVFTNSLKDLYLCKAIFIASSSETHVKYIKIFIKKNLLLFCEKPPATNYKDLNYLKRLPKNQKKKIIFNFQLPVSPIYLRILDIIKNNKLGNFIKINIYSGHGIAFKKNFKNNWRFNKRNIYSNIVGNLGIHYVHLFIKIFSNVKIVHIKRENYSNSKNYDTAEICFKNRKSVFSSVFLSYAVPFIDNIVVIFTNGLIKYFKNNLKIYYPRDTFDKHGNYKLANNIDVLNISQKDNLRRGTENMLNKFFYVLKNKKNFEIKEFQLSIKSNHMLLDYYKK